MNIDPISRRILLQLILVIYWAIQPAVAQTQPPIEPIKPEPDPLLLQQAQTAFDQGDAARSIFLYTQLLKQQPTNYSFQVRLAIALLNYGPEFLYQAYRAFERAHELNSNYSEPILFLARIDEALERHNLAKKRYQQLLQKEPSHTEAFMAIQRLQAFSALPTLPENLQLIADRSIEDYLSAYQENSTEIAGLQKQVQIAKRLDYQRFFPFVSFNYGTVESDTITLDPTAPLFSTFPGEIVFQERPSSGDSDSFSITLQWNLGNLFLNENAVRKQAFSNQLDATMERLEVETIRLYTSRQSAINQLYQLAWTAALNPGNRSLVQQRRDLYLQIFWQTQQLHQLTKLW